MKQLGKELDFHPLVESPDERCVHVVQSSVLTVQNDSAPHFTVVRLINMAHLHVPVIIQCHTVCRIIM